MAPQQRREHLLDAALTVIVRHGYEGVSIEAIARTAGVTRPVIYDHFPNLGQLLSALIEREESAALAQLATVVPERPSTWGNPAELFAAGIRRFLEAIISRPDSWRVILLPPEGTPATVREHVEVNRGRIQERIALLVRWAIERSRVPDDLDVELAARAIRSLSEEAGRQVLTDPEHFSPERYERFALAAMKLILA
ncbi:MAG: TetR/AcrR family transcriptional regulator [Actinomycetota bacterium]|nr:TetR/AcrR family transcriptional regulator [Actinomycetota bacterium]